MSDLPTRVASREISPQQMEAHIVRFRQMKPRSREAQAALGIPPEVSEFMAADRNYTYVAPQLEHHSPITRFAAMRGGDHGDALTISLAVCAPGKGPQLHAHMKTVESFFCLKGRFEVRWGDAGEHATVIEPYDLIAVPAGVVRTFCNVSEEEGHLLVVIQGNRHEFNDVHHTPAVGRTVEERFGVRARELLEATGRRFDVGA
jgi:mannose-6-phosphate isomerase-like protein (cupin superfamily)